MKICIAFNKFTILFLILSLFSCSKDKQKNTELISSAKNSIDDTLKNSIDDTLLKGDFEGFYRYAKEQNLEILKNNLEQLEPKQRASLNYGALLNAGIITKENRHLFKPDIKKINYYVDISNDNRCWMNSTLYSIANSYFFDDFLEVDLILKDTWKKRPAANIDIANKIMRSLREIIYEIRLGPNTTSERLVKARERHAESLKVLKDLAVAVSFYHELFVGYNLEGVEYVEKDIKSARLNFIYTYKYNSISDLKLSEDMIENLKQQIMEKGIGSQVQGNGWVIANLGKQLCSSMPSFYEPHYLVALFIMLDPWGATARYFSVRITDQTVPEDKREVSYGAPSLGNLRLTLDSENIYFFIKDSIFNGNYFNWNDNSLFKLRDIATKKPLGHIMYERAADASLDLTLVAKTKGSEKNIHLIAELFNFMQKKWETHRFLSPFTLSNTESSYEDGNYKDYTFFYQNKK
ncbi:MAG: hypothetical protein H6731_02370 [Myxococcales bacterium]|nr:MAG: hypothetical protein H6731_02370 [Myxococcales bacterium]